VKEEEFANQGEAPNEVDDSERRDSQKEKLVVRPFDAGRTSLYAR
jgi:hypothetical protein